ncbi:MAG: ABC transporter ATP-binding protein [Woeseiaceae bacterium]|nr:ABC transporter ATP-binding protein [Woeseiaceae bacterium]
MTQTFKNTLTIKNLEKSFNDVMALNDISLEVQEGEFCSLLGASGSGKTTLLRVIAGFESPDKGSLEINGRNLNSLPIANRNIGMVFQNYALFPHMSVRENVAFGLEMQKLKKIDINTRVNEALQLVELTNEATRFPNQLSGGQQQRVALARAIVIKPSLLLMDEPLGALDKNLRKEMQAQIKELHKNINATIIYVTHDQEEAMYLSDRIVLLDQGKIIQSGTCKELYSSPKNRMVANFLGECNFIKLKDGRNITIRPESFEVLDRKTNENGIEVTVRDLVFLGSYTKLIGSYNQQEITVTFRSSDLDPNIRKLDKVHLTFNKECLINL